ncbi:MAG: aminotransferase class I/II-fold pyridoxal phosphate-dependent enzyme [Solobacterium sp.]|nr:aminotransferase class I/II-fold pyridoxal phosphate-dependent enzyme [Solobacterium sp.]
MSFDQDKAPVFEASMQYAERRPAYFCVPGHRYENGTGTLLREYAGDNIFKIDITETGITDDLHCPSGAIKEAQELAAALWGADWTFFLVNGSTCGNQAMILSALKPSESILVAGNSHRSVNSALILSGAKPVYIMPEYISDWGIYGGIGPEEAEKMFRLHPECRAMIVTSPSYYGIVSDIRALAEICHRHGALLLVDEAHGTHCYFSAQLPEGALACGADMCVQSLHKTGGALTQSSLLHVKSSRTDIDMVRKSLQIVQSSSPSYILLNSIDTARRDLALHGRDMMRNAFELASLAREKINAIPGMRCAGRELEGTASVFRFDETRLVISASQMGITGFDLKTRLFEEYNVEVEMADRRNFLAIVSYANSREDIDRLVSALERIAKDHPQERPLKELTDPPKQTFCAITPREAFFAGKKTVSWEEAEGCISAEMIDLSPPGIPLIRPGEIFSREILDYLKQIRLAGGLIQGLPDDTMEKVTVIA